MSAQAAEDNQDQSMEEILQSIKRIIADEEEEGSEAVPAAESDSGSDVLELTDLVEDDGTVQSVEAEEETANDVGMMEAPMPKKEEKPAEPAKADDDSALVSDSAAQASADALKSLANKPKPEPRPMPKVESPAFRSGQTVEDLVMEALKPMLKDWLDSNLPGIVEHLVEKEVKRISGQ